MIASICLQSAWLIQLFRAQQFQVKRDLDWAVENAARKSEYLSIAPGHESNKNFGIFSCQRNGCSSSRLIQGCNIWVSRAVLNLILRMTAPGSVLLYASPIKGQDEAKPV
nr:hypothetical protein [uncultured Chryseobacterium sp.]